MIKGFKGSSPEFDKTNYIAETALLIGNVRLGRNTSIWPNVVLRGDINSIQIGENSNVQDNSTLHVSKKDRCIIGNNVTIGHNSVVHGSKVGDNCIIGIGSILLNGSVIGKNSIIAAGAVVREGMVVPENSLVVGVPGVIKKKLDDAQIERIKRNAEEYVMLKDKYLNEKK